METKNIMNESGIIITIILILIPVIAAAVIVLMRASATLQNFRKKKEYDQFKNRLKSMTTEEVDELKLREKELEYALGNNELTGTHEPRDKKGLIDNVFQIETFRFIEKKKKGSATSVH